MYVSMNPSGETGKAIHISQDDTNREVEFIPFDQNGLVKTTSDETVAHINSIKGNTVSFNQLVQPTTGNAQTINGITFTPNGDGSITVSGSASGGNAIFYCPQSVLIANHKYYGRGCPSGGNTNTYSISFRDNSASVVLGNDEGNGVLFTPTQNYSASSTLIRIVSGTSFYSAVKFYPQIFDLTLMGIDNLATVTEVESWLSSHIGNLPYFDYTQGTLISFNGTGLKTTGKNLLDTSSWIINNNLHVVSIQGFPNTKYTIQSNIPLSIGGSNQGTVYLCNSTESPSLGSNATYEGKTITTTTNANGILNIYYHDRNYITNWGDWNIMLQIGEIATSYEPYTTNTLSLPTSTYFPTGMKSAGSVYDELSDKAYTRVGSVDLGTLTWTYESTYNIWVGLPLPDNIKPTTAVLSGTFPYHRINLVNLNELGSNVNQTHNIWVRNGSSTVEPSGIVFFELATPTETDISLDLTYPVWNGGTEQILPINDSTPDTAPIKANITYPDRTEDTEFLYKQTSFVFIPRTWAFVCKNITQALTLVGNVLKGTIPSGMTSESGKFPLKLKMSDEDGVCFSEKIDLYVERKP